MPPQQGGHALTPTCPGTTSQAIRERGRASPARVDQLQRRLSRLRSGSLVVLVVLVARESGPVPGAHHLHSSLRVVNFVTERGIIPSHHAITDTVPGSSIASAVCLQFGPQYFAIGGPRGIRGFLARNVISDS